MTHWTVPTAENFPVPHLFSSPHDLKPCCRLRSEREYGHHSPLHNNTITHCQLRLQHGQAPEARQWGCKFSQKLSHPWEAFLRLREQEIELHKLKNSFYIFAYYFMHVCACVNVCMCVGEKERKGRRSGGQEREKDRETETVYVTQYT